MQYFVDVQGFKDFKNNFIVKEFATASQVSTQVYLIKPPYSYSNLSQEEKRSVHWLEKNRGIYWSEGYIDYKEFKRIIKPFLRDKEIFVKGQEKMKWIMELCEYKSVINLENRGCPNLSNLLKIYDYDSIYNCFFHKKYCALKNVICLRQWFNQNKNSFN